MRFLAGPPHFFAVLKSLLTMSSKTTEKNTPVSSYKKDAPYKLTSAAQQDSVQSDSSLSSSNPLKRPRGRPPLVSHKPTKVVSKPPANYVKSVSSTFSRPHIPQAHKVQSNAVVSSVLQHQASKPILQAPPVIASSTSHNQAIIPTATVDNTNNEPGEQQSKAPKPSSSEVTNKLIALLMVSDPTSIADVCKQLPELPRESIQSVLEVLQVLGIVIQMMSSKDTVGSKSGSSSNIVYLYALAEYAKFNAAFPITQLCAESRIKEEATLEVKARIKELQV